MNHEAFVSVLMTAYNRQNFIAEAIESVLASTYKNFELIIVDDCSKDSTVAIAKGYEKSDSRVKVYVNEINLTDYVNRNKAASYAVGKYLKYVDSDDVLYPHGLEVMVRGMERFPEAALGMIYGLPTNEPSPILYSSYEAWYSYFFKNIWLQVGPSGCIYKRDAFEMVGGFSGKPYVGDFELNMKLSALYPVVRLQTDLFFYRVHDNRQSVEQGKSNKINYLNHQVNLEALKSPHCPLSPEEKNIAFRIQNKLQSRRALQILLKNRRPDYFKEMVLNSSMGWRNFLRGLLSVK